MSHRRRVLWPGASKVTDAHRFQGCSRPSVIEHCHLCGGARTCGSPRSGIEVADREGAFRLPGREAACVHGEPRVASDRAARSFLGPPDRLPEGTAAASAGRGIRWSRCATRRGRRGFAHGLSGDRLLERLSELQRRLRPVLSRRPERRRRAEPLHPDGQQLVPDLQQGRDVSRRPVPDQHDLGGGW